LLPNASLRIGRDPDKQSNDVAFVDSTVSRNHAEFYSIIVDEDERRHYPLVFVRDRQSSNGTFVNHRVIGKGPSLSSGWLLEDGDVIAISPLVTFTFTQHSEPSPYQLSSHQREEAKVSRPGVRRAPAIRTKPTLPAREVTSGACTTKYIQAYTYNDAFQPHLRCASSIFPVVQMAIFQLQRA
jgi:hypothetical protein